MEIIKTGRKGRYLNTLEKYHIYEIGKDNLHMNYTNTDIRNPMFKSLHRIYTKNDSTYFSLHPFFYPPHHPHPQATTAQY
jgi:hypothetical protein